MNSYTFEVKFFNEFGQPEQVTRTTQAATRDRARTEMERQVCEEFGCDDVYLKLVRVTPLEEQPSKWDTTWPPFQF